MGQDREDGEGGDPDVTAEPAQPQPQPPAVSAPQPPAVSAPQPPAVSAPQPPAAFAPQPPAAFAPQPPAAFTPQPPAVFEREVGEAVRYERGLAAKAVAVLAVVAVIVILLARLYCALACRCRLTGATERDGVIATAGRRRLPTTRLEGARRRSAHAARTPTAAAVTDGTGRTSHGTRCSARSSRCAWWSRPSRPSAGDGLARPAPAVPGAAPRPWPRSPPATTAPSIPAVGPAELADLGRGIELMRTRLVATLAERAAGRASASGTCSTRPRTR